MTFFRFGSELDPMNHLLRLQRDLERAFEHPLGRDFGLSGRGVFPPVNVFSDADGYVVRLEVPGVAPENLHIESHGRTLKVSGKRELKPAPGGSFHRRERSEGEFSRSIQLPQDLDLERAEASCKLGLLTIRIPKRAETKPRQINVRAA